MEARSVQIRTTPAKEKVEKPAPKLNFYHEIPNLEISLDDFEEYALYRLKVLKMIERYLLKGKRTDDTDKRFFNKDPKFTKLLKSIHDYKIDWVSHFVLRLAYCRSEDLRRWFLAQEVALLKLRIKHGEGKGARKALKDILGVEAISKEEREDLMPKIQAATFMKIGTETENIYAVPFTKALDLVQRRSVFVKRGMAYIPESKLVTVVCERFRASLSRQLVLLSGVPATPASERTQDFLKNVVMVQSEVKSGYEKTESDLNASNVPSHIKHMPLCMAKLQMGLQSDRHLKHWSRNQYGLFLKGAGLSLEDALTYFARMFVKEFGREYQYVWRYMYGKEGKRQDFSPYGCNRIINGNAPNAGDHHGCPYKHGSINEISFLLTKLGVKDQKSILAEAKSKQYQLACLEHFKVMHPNIEKKPVSVDDVGNHPNAWFRASVAFNNLGDQGDGAAMSNVKDEPMNVSSQSSVAVSP